MPESQSKFGEFGFIVFRFFDVFDVFPCCFGGCSLTRKDSSREGLPSSGACPVKSVVSVLDTSCFQPLFHSWLHCGRACDVHPLNRFFGDSCQVDGTIFAASSFKTGAHLLHLPSSSGTTGLLVALLLAIQQSFGGQLRGFIVLVLTRILGMKSYMIC